MKAAAKLLVQISCAAAPMVLLRLMLFAALWWALAGAGAWSIGVPAVLLAGGVSLRLAPARARWHVRPALRFLCYFISRSLSAGFDVALRAFASRPRIAPEYIEYPMHLPAGPARVLFANVVSLVPGSLCAAIDDGRLCVHVLDAAMPVATELRSLEQRVGAIFGIDVPPLNNARPR